MKLVNKSFAENFIRKSLQNSEFFLIISMLVDTLGKGHPYHMQQEKGRTVGGLGPFSFFVPENTIPESCREVNTQKKEHAGRYNAFWEKNFK